MHAIVFVSIYDDELFSDIFTAMQHRVVLLWPFLRLAELVDVRLGVELLPILTIILLHFIRFQLKHTKINHQE